MKKGYVWTWNAFVFLSFMLMAGLYSRVVYTLWFKDNDHCELTHQQQVLGKSSVLFCSKNGLKWEWEGGYMNACHKIAPFNVFAFG